MSGASHVGKFFKIRGTNFHPKELTGGGKREGTHPTNGRGKKSSLGAGVDGGQRLESSFLRRPSACQGGEQSSEQVGRGKRYNGGEKKTWKGVAHLKKKQAVLGRTHAVWGEGGKKGKESYFLQGTLRTS